VLGGSIDGLRVVKSGLAVKDQVVVDGVQRVFFTGMPLKATLVEMGKPAAPEVAAR